MRTGFVEMEIGYEMSVDGSPGVHCGVSGLASARVGAR